MRKLLLTGNCQIGVLAQGLRVLLPSVEVLEHSLDAINEPGGIDEVATRLGASDVWVRMPMMFNDELEAARQSRSEVLEIPSVGFTAFHPDSVFATTSGGKFIVGEYGYQSALVAWGWNHRLSASETVSLFDEQLMLELGYDRHWDVAVSGLRSSFDTSDLDWSECWPRLVRLGVFMHTVNHPTSQATAVIAKAVATLLEPTGRGFWNFPLDRYLLDNLADKSWPVYPVVARRMGLSGCYTWRNQGRLFHSPAQWVDASFHAYDADEINQVVFQRELDSAFDEVLFAHIQRSGLVGGVSR